MRWPAFLVAASILWSTKPLTWEDMQTPVRAPKRQQDDYLSHSKVCGSPKIQQDPLKIYCAADVFGFSLPRH